MWTKAFAIPSRKRWLSANDFIQRFHFPLPISVDDMHETADLAYGGWPERIYIIDESGKIAYRGGLGPFNYHPEEARAWLEKKFGPTHAGNNVANAKN